MSRQLAVAAAFSVFALSALALFAPGSVHLHDGLSARNETGATMSIAAPAFAARLPLGG
ncbi:MAG: hypothetical protein RLZZ08_595 [Pseudomonadota bacterium]